jgi:hypothetical protein
MNKFTVLCLALCLSVVFAKRPAAEIFNGAYSYFNSSKIINGVNTLGGVGKIGTIMYAPAFPGALYGNMSVCYGTVMNSSNTPNEALSGFSAYTGPYVVNEEEGFVTHYPIIVSNPISGFAARGVPQVRYYDSFNNDNLIYVNSRTEQTYIYWARINPFPEPPTCTLSATVTRSSSWVSGGSTFQQYSLVLKNTGDSTITSAQVTFNLGSSIAIDSSWNMAQVSGNTYSVALFSGLARGKTSTSVGFITKGTGPFSVAVPPSATVCN